MAGALEEDMAGALQEDTRVQSSSSTPLPALILGAVIIIYLLMWRLESLEKEYIELHHDHTSLVGKPTDQSSLLTNGLMLKLGIPVPPGKAEHKQEGKADTSTPPTASHGAQTQPPPASSAPTMPSPAGSPPTKAEPAQPRQVTPSPTSEPKTETSPTPQPKVESSPEGEKRGVSH